MSFKLPRNKGFFEYYEELVGTWTRRLKCRHQAEDLTHDAYLRILGTDPDTIEQPRAYLHRTARNIAVDGWRRDERRTAPLDSLDEASHLDDPEAHMHAQQLADGIEKALAELPPNCRQVFVWQKLEGLTQAEIAERMGLSRNMVERYMIRTLRHLRERLDDAQP